MSIVIEHVESATDDARALIGELDAELSGPLETGDAQHAAIRLYERAGFTRCAAFGGYAAMPPAAIERCVFFEKWIG